MFPGSYWGARYYAPRYWPKVGADTVAAPGDEITTAPSYFGRAVTTRTGRFGRAATITTSAFGREVTTKTAER